MACWACLDARCSHSRPTVTATALSTWLPNRDTVAYLNGVYLTEERLGPVNILAWWAKDDDGKPIVHAVMTNLPATWQTYRRGSRRMWIETVFRDWQSGGFHLDDSGVTRPGAVCAAAAAAGDCLPVAGGGGALGGQARLPPPGR